MRTVQVQELKQNLASIVDEVERGERILITRHGRPVASLVPPLLEGVHVGADYGRGALSPMRAAGIGRPIADTLAADRAVDR